jgi:AraC-like DNA-binding protein/mannose-6-phosphate isomerase-like protein (cupin superfamily)
MGVENLVSDRAVRWNQDVENKLNRFPIVLHSDEWMKGTDYHNHPGLEIHMTLAGSGTMVIGKQIFPQTHRSVLVFRGKVPHQMISRSSYKRSVISINTGDEETLALPSLHRLIDFTWIPDNTCLSFSLTPKQFYQIEDIYKELRQEFVSKNVGWERVVLAHVLHITALLQRSSSEVEPDATSAPLSVGKKSDMVMKCADYVCRHLGEDLSLKAIAQRFAISPEHLTRLFTKEMGISFYQYVLLQRVAEGKRLLVEAPDVTISEIAYTIGFPSSAHFCRHFKTLTEETPSAFRHKMMWPPTVL